MDTKHAYFLVLLTVATGVLAACIGGTALPSLTTAPTHATETLAASIQPSPTIAPSLAESTAEATRPAITRTPTMAPTLGTSVPQKNGPLLLLITDGRSADDGDVWAWDASNRPLRRLTSYGYNHSPVISPDGRYVAYDSIPQGDAPWECSGFPPANIWVLNIANGDAVRAAEQPPDRGPGSCGGTNFIQRPPPAWSPDSKWLAWGEHQVPDPTNRLSYRLVQYNLEKKSQQVIVSDLPGDQSITYGQQVDWSLSGIADFTWPGNLLVVYDAGGKQLFRTQFDSKFNACHVGPGMLARWVTDNSGFFIYLQDCSDPFPQYLIDPTTGKQSQTSGRLELYSTTAPGGFSLFMTQDSDSSVLWHVAAPGNTVSDLDVIKNFVNDNPSALDMVAISPDGRQVAYLSDNGLMLYDGSGPAVSISVALQAGQEIDWIGWGPTGWRIGHP